MILIYLQTVTLNNFKSLIPQLFMAMHFVICHVIDLFEPLLQKPSDLSATQKGIFKSNPFKSAYEIQVKYKYFYVNNSTFKRHPKNSLQIVFSQIVF